MGLTFLQISKVWNNVDPGAEAYFRPVHCNIICSALFGGACHLVFKTLKSQLSILRALRDLLYKNWIGVRRGVCTAYLGFASILCHVSYSLFPRRSCWPHESNPGYRPDILERISVLCNFGSDISCK